MNNGNYTVTLKQPGFFAFFCTQFLGAFNDNFLKIVVSFVALSLAGHGGDFYVELIAILFILPSALFSGYAGHLAEQAGAEIMIVHCYSLLQKAVTFTTGKGEVNKDPQKWILKRIKKLKQKHPGIIVDFKIILSRHHYC